MAAGEFNIATWAKEFELTADTIDALAQKGFATKRTLAKLTPELIKAEFKKLSLAQLFMVQDACESLQPSGAAQAVNTDSVIHVANTGSAVQAGDNGDASQTVGPSNVSPTDGPQGAPLTAQEIAAFMETGHSVLSEEGKYGKPHLFDPFQFELNKNSAKHLYRDIRDFISLVPKNTETQSSASVQIGMQEFLLKDSKIPWDLLNATQYMEGSLKIMREMAIHDKCSIGELLEYTNYLIKIATLGQCFDWPSILKYDQAYRKAQATGGFSWGADNAYLMQLYLQPKTPKTQQLPQLKKQAAGQSKVRHCKFDPDSGNQICMKWNSNNGCNFRGCKFAHKCSTCFSQTHPECRHTQNTRPTEPGNP